MPMIALPETFADATTIDLHMHSTASDGALAPGELMQLCQSRGLSHVALTDHDTVAGVDEARSEAERLGIALLAGTELSVQWRGMTIHVLGYLPDGVRGTLVDGLVAQAAAREARNLEIARRLEAIGLDDALERARATVEGDRPLGRPDFARALVAAELVPDMAAAFKRYLGAGKRGDVKMHWPYLGEAVGWVRDAGGVAVLAHPLRYKLTRRKRGLLLDDFADAGGAGAELISGFQNPDETRDLARQLNERELLASKGSDFHFPGGYLAPGSMSEAPRTAVAPLWQHPALGGFAVG
ncbi:MULTISPECIES: PHP domain-containing protein [Modicisalibacter]|uniref:PHP domain-containing protein n=1 Tax=Modicisalibacter TaxID=574347 RepID=UPI00100BF829|nr:MULTISPECIES: PHP domain-containing protein [Halomonadaceae]MBZ9559460.1 PHP domain-containing protein [Modicisalibacter sp. R2A 31.J]MBZ9576374.1 PHP domain-containing protein [Modicisalibacter sp. MOD 31.J]